MTLPAPYTTPYINYDFPLQSPRTLNNLNYPTRVHQSNSKPHRPTTRNINKPRNPPPNAQPLSPHPPPPPPPRASPFGISPQNCATAPAARPPLAGRRRSVRALHPGDDHLGVTIYGGLYQSAGRALREDDQAAGYDDFFYSRFHWWSSSQRGSVLAGEQTGARPNLLHKDSGRATSTAMGMPFTIGQTTLRTTAALQRWRKPPGGSSTPIAVREIVILSDSNNARFLDSRNPERNL